MRIGRTAMVFAAMLAIFLAGCAQQSVDDSKVIDDSGNCVKREAYTAEVPYNDTDYEWVEVCYDRQEYCKDKVYTDFTVELTREGNTCVMTVRNTGETGGNWKLHAKFVVTAAGGGQCSDPVTKNIATGQTARFEFPYDGKDPLLRCEKTCSQDEVPIVKDCPCYTRGQERKPVLVTKYRTETRYREVPC